MFQMVSWFEIEIAVVVCSGNKQRHRNVPRYNRLFSSVVQGALHGYWTDTRATGAQLKAGARRGGADRDAGIGEPRQRPDPDAADDLIEGSDRSG